MKQTFSIILMFLCNIMIFGQSAIRIKYVLDYKLDSLNLNNVNREIMVLDYLPNDNKSYFRSDAVYKKDSVATTSNPMALFSMGIKKPKFNYTILKDHKNENIISYEDYISYRFKVEDDVSFQWKIHNNETKEILGKKCILATTSFRGRDYEAWFTPEIPISDGPYKFFGLGGLILEIYDTEKHYHFQAFHILQSSDYKTYLDTNSFTKISKKDFKKFLNNLREKPSMALNVSGISIASKNGQGNAMDNYDRKRRESAKKENNFIEKKDN